MVQIEFFGPKPRLWLQTLRIITGHSQSCWHIQLYVNHMVTSPANRHDSISLEPLLKGRILEPENEATPQNLCLDAAYVGKENVVEGNGFIPHIRPRGEEKKLIEKDPNFKARRWVVELAHSWFNRFRKLLPRYEKTDLSYNALNALAAAMIVLNKIMIIYR